jgi:hypothetical protein
MMNFKTIYDVINLSFWQEPFIGPLHVIVMKSINSNKLLIRDTGNFRMVGKKMLADKMQNVVILYL